MKKIFSFATILLLLVSCSNNKTVDNNNTNEIGQNENNNSDVGTTIEENTFEEFSVLVTTKVLNVRSDPNTEDDNKIGQVYMGDKYIVYEQTKDNIYTWYRIGENKWIANDGTWCIEYGNNGLDEFPHVLNSEEIKEFLKTIHTGVHCYSGYKNNQDCYFFNIFEEPQYIFDCNILFGTSCTGGGIEDVYHYNVNDVVKIDINTYDVYIVPVKNNGHEDYSTGCLRFSNIRIEPFGIGEMESLMFDVTFLQNKNDATDRLLENIYNIEIQYAPSHFSW